jgi:ubiquitin-like 1-activating enzyme E1 A
MSSQVEPESKKVDISRYDRQVRLWGAESQQKMMNSRVLYIHVTGVTAEILKNLALAGIKATLCDTRPAADMAPHFFTPTGPPEKRLKYASVAHAVQPLVEEMNPLLEGCPILEKEVSDLTEEDLKAFTVIVASQIKLEEAVRLSKLANKLHSQFYLADCFGWNGAALMDLGKDLTYRPEQGKKLLDPVPLPSFTSLEDLVQIPLHQCVNRFHKTPPPIYLQYRCLLEYQAKKGHFPGGENQDNFDDTVLPAYLKSQQAELSKDALTALQTAGMAQVSPVCAVLGGILGNEIIKVISGKGEPANNTLLFDGKICKAWSFLVQPKKA